MAGREPGTADLSAVEEHLTLRGLAHRSLVVETLEDATKAAHRAVASGDRFVVAVGGDPVVGAVVNGILGVPEAEPVLGVVSGSAPSDFARTFGLPADPPRACAHLDGDGVLPIDAVRASYRTAGGVATTHFVNLAEVGLGAATAARTARLSSAMGRLRPFVGFWWGLAASRPRRLVLRGDRRTWEGVAHSVIVANGQYARGGYRLSPRSWPSDGFLDVLVMKGPRSDAFTLLDQSVLGEHLPHPNIVEYRSRTLSIDASRPLPLLADGVLLGTTPAAFEVLPLAVRLKV